ncbi:MAG: hypothetical protein GY917_07225, partial [Planctomycetaceae bacterium]|nr:hypothetical protein [Planctomycetaceae bacterium]
MINRFDQTWQETQSSGVLAEHPLRLLNPHLANIDRPLKRITEALEPCAELFERVRERLQKSHLPGQYWDTVATLLESLNLARQLEPFALQNILPLLDTDHPRAIEFEEGLKALKGLEKALAEQQKKTALWRTKLPREELEIALQQARAYEGKVTRFFLPGWWRLRNVLICQYDFSEHLLRPPWTQVLETLLQEYQCQDDIAAAQQELRDRFELSGDLASIVEQIAQVRNPRNG